MSQVEDKLTAVLQDRPIEGDETPPICTNLLEKDRRKKKPPCGETKVRVGSFWMCRKCDQHEGQNNF